MAWLFPARGPGQFKDLEKKKKNKKKKDKKKKKNKNKKKDKGEWMDSRYRICIHHNFLLVIYFEYKLNLKTF